MICHFRTKNDVNGNSRTLWAVMVYCQGWSDGCPLIEPYKTPIIIKDAYNPPKLVKLITAVTGAYPLDIDIPPSEYRRLLKTAKYWTQSDIAQAEEEWVQE